jgi:hypothetical protein
MLLQVAAQDIGQLPYMQLGRPARPEDGNRDGDLSQGGIEVGQRTLASGLRQAAPQGGRVG